MIETDIVLRQKVHEVNEFISKQQKWCNENMINRTPTVLLDSKEIPALYSVGYIRNFI